jgi:hypothetical protein
MNLLNFLKENLAKASWLHRAMGVILTLVSGLIEIKGKY